MAAIFSEPFDLDEIERILYDDDFLQIAHLMVGREGDWREALDQVNRLLTVFEERARDAEPIYRMVSILVQRTAQLPNRDGRLAEIKTRLGLLPSVQSQRTMPILQAEASVESQADKNKKWLEDYRAKRHSRT
jgi:hypothetical protein